MSQCESALARSEFGKTCKTMWLLAQAVDPETLPPIVDPHFVVPPAPGWWGLMLTWIPWLYVPLLLWMAWWCARHDPERGVWLWIILLFQPLGAVIYFLARWLPASQWEPPDFLRRFTRQGEIHRLQIAASQIGNPHQFIELGEALRETGQMVEAGAAFKNALAKDPDNLQALWGAGSVCFHEHNYEQAREHLSKLIAEDPTYKFGDVSLLHAKTLRCLGQNDAARAHLEEHIRRWRHPEALYLLASIYVDQGEFRQAREQLQALIMDLDSSPRAIARKHMVWRGRARKLLRRLPA